ncbi:MAG: hypothetical protein R2761_29620 [Acidimicrobiales bacterium]
MEALVARLAGEVRARPVPFLVAIDGRSGAGKSTLAAAVAAALGSFPAGNGPAASVIEGDQFYAGGSAATWDGRPVPERASAVIDWRRQRAVLAELRSRGRAEWRPFDWHADDWDADDAPLAAEPIELEAGPVVILEGAYSARPELHDLLDLRVLLLAPAPLRTDRLRHRDGDTYHADWAARWSSAEDHYFGSVMPPSRFDLVLGLDR